jgi:hypothetical protein
MSATRTKATGKKASRLPVPSPAAMPAKTTYLKLTAGTVTALASLKQLGYSNTFAIERGVLMFVRSLNSGGAK